MEWTIRLEPAGPHVRVTTRGVFNVTDHLRMIEDILSQPFWVPGMRAFFDHRRLDMGDTTYAVMSAAGENHLKHDDRIGAGKAAVVMGLGSCNSEAAVTM